MATLECRWYALAAMILADEGKLNVPVAEFRGLSSYRGDARGPASA